ncbi:dual oxidase-like isoform X3 [Mya arenaria]|nr:dual oxidase-like isoform X3 [Mya arenaria]XP_052805243.1 dual oxidase-like isoform X3 [Mya arenaria]XP_052805244.1 dual oxidase-like isoform X3 [Mya arenaria]XP_052805245.1 dual oxidase-like isoform X3 [Mya arenaria]XP_052805246.1 dual oxidase-like isoform X3 [Mya arenaria]XP_052805247.1 dual oxidase-like isoform X3 [Mya arenaria]XP_052805248.1 dual oxidase-like isoform X3 [Mya arenaria]
MKLGSVIVVCILFHCGGCFTQQRFDGFYNNLITPGLGSAGKPLKQNITTAYSDYTYKLSGQNRPSPRLISELLFKKDVNFTYTPNGRNLTAMFAFFGQLVALELIDTDDTTCPVELLTIPVPACDPEFDPSCSGSKHLPYERIAYDKRTGQSPNVPRKQVNKATSYIDGSFVYGNSLVRALHLQAFRSPKLASGDAWSKYPQKNTEGLPFVASPDPIEHKFHDQYEMWKLGDKHVQENPGILSLAVLFFRWHNAIVDELDSRAHHGFDETFDKARQMVIASLQNVIVYEWVPLLLGESLPPYTGYKSDIYPDVTALFDAAAIRYIMTLLPAGINQRDSKCASTVSGKYKGVRMCNTYWRSQDVLMEREDELEETLIGLVSQLADAEDLAVVEDLQSKYFGPLHFSRHDLVSLTIMRGRDYGLPDYNTVRKLLGLPRINRFSEINVWLNGTSPEVIARLEELYGSVDDIDVFVGGMFETTPEGPGELFKTVIRDQFIRIRDGDRFWFENKDNGQFSDEEIERIKAIRLYDILNNSTRYHFMDVRPNVFQYSETNETDSCPPIYMHESQLEPCSPHKGYDYFAGSEASYIIVWVSFGLIPLVCLLFVWVLSKCKTYRYMRNVQVLAKNLKDNIGDQLGGALSQHRGTEWQGPEESRLVIVRVRPERKLEVINLKGKLIRSINLDHLKHVHCLLSDNKKRNVVMIRIPKEYDFVIQMTNESQRREFIQSLKQAVTEHEDVVDCHETKEKHIYMQAFTQKKRNQLLERFFKIVFSEAFQMDYDPTLDQEEVETRQTRDILEIELTREEFATALAMKSNSEFVENMFSLMDSDHNGYISFREFLNAVVMLSKGSGQDKLQILFRMFDHDGNGTLDRGELIKLFSSLLEMANSSLTKNDVENLVESICVQQGLTSEDSINFDDFCTILSPHMDKLWNAGLEWKGCKNYLPSTGDEKRKSSGNLRRLSAVITNMFNAEARKRVNQTSDTTHMVKSESSASISSTDSALAENLTQKRQTFIAIRETYTPLKAKMKRLKHFVENNRQHIFYLVIFFGICIGLFAERFYYYTVEREHSGLRALMSYGISTTRGAAAVMSFCFSLLLLTMLRNTITFLRETFLNLYAPFDSIVSFHKVIAWTALFFTAMHVIGYGFNFYHLATQPTKYLCIFDTVVFRADIQPTFNFWFFGNLTGFTGLLLVIIICIVYVYATQLVRRLIFNAFWLSHKLIGVMYVLTILHGASMIVQKPMFYVYFVIPAILFTIDKMISLSRKRMEISIVRAENLASDVTFIEFKRPPRFEYKSGQWVRIACLAQGPNEYHPFTLTSAPHEDTLSLYIRAVGPWTHALRNIFDQENLKQQPFPKLYLDGPYGAGQQDWYTYDVSVLVGAGIGVTPYASILKDFVHMTSIKSTYKIRCQKLYFIWVTGSQRHFEWLLDILQEVESIDTKGMVSIDIFITQFFQNFDLRTAMLYICEEHFQKLSGGKSVFTSLKANTHFGRPHLSSMFKTLHRAHPMVRKIGVFSCGPPGVTKSVERACVDSSRTTKALFEHHFENF